MHPVTPARGRAKAAATAKVVDLTRVSRPCATGKHNRCMGRVYLPKPAKDGSVYARCECGKCKHPEAWMT